MVLVTALVTLITTLRSPSFQELAGRIATGYLSEKYNIDIRLDKLRINDLLYLEIHGLLINDHHNREMLRVDEMRIKTDYISLSDRILYFDRVSLDSGGFHLEWYPGDSMINLNYFIERLASETAISDKPGKAWEIRCKDFSVDGMAFTYFSGDTNYWAGINFENLGISNVFIDIKDIIILDDSITAYVDHIAFSEKSGFELLNFSGDTRVSQSGILVKGAQISTGSTSLDLDLEFAYNGYEKLGWFLDSVYMDATVRSSLVTFADIGYFAPELMGMQDPVMFSGQVKGPVSNFMATGLNLSLGEFTEFEGEISMKGLPDFYSTFTRLQIDKLNTTPEDISSFILPLTGNDSLFPAELIKIGFTSAWGWFEGYPENFSTSLEINTDVGSLTIDGDLSAKSADSIIDFSGIITGTSIQLGEILSSEDLGTVNLDLKFEGAGSSFEDIEIDIDGSVRDLEYRDYIYENILVDGLISGKSFNGIISVLDPSVSLKVNGLADFNGQYPVLDMTANIGMAHLSQLNLADRSEDMNISGTLSVDLQGLDPDTFKGTIIVENFDYRENDTTYHMDRLELSRGSTAGQGNQLSLRSDYIDGEITGTFSIEELAGHLLVFLLDKQLDPVRQQELDSKPQNIAFDFRLKDFSPITNLFIPDLSISPGSEIRGKFDSEHSLLELEGQVADITYSGIRLEQLVFTGNTNRKDFELDIGVTRVLFSETVDGTGIGIDNLSANIFSGHDSVKVSLGWDNNMPDNPNRGSLNGYVKFINLSKFEVGLGSAEGIVSGNKWRVAEDNLVVYDSTKISVRNFAIYKDEENFVVDGELSSSPEDTLSVYFHKWSLANFNPFLKGMSLELSGIIDGRFGIFRNQKVPNIFAGLSIADFTVNKVFFGNAELNTRWLESNQALALDLNIFSRGTQEDPYKILGVNGMYYPFDKKRNFDFDITAQNLNISVLEPLLTSFSSHLEGFATGKLTLDGTLAKPLLLGRLKLQRTEMLVDYLNVMYSFSNEVVFTRDMIQFNELTVFDPVSNKAVLTGGIKHDYFKDMSLDLTIKPENFMALNLNRYQNEIFYGKAYATGTVRLYGPFQNLTIEVDATTEKGTDMTIPINYSVDVSQNDFIVFTNAEDTLNPGDEKEVQLVGVSLDIDMNVTRAADVEIILPGNIGNIKASGSGNLRLGVDRNYYLTLYGSYKIYTGLFVFSLEELVNRRFVILEGSSISWTGDLYDAEVSIVARYRLRTSLEGLGITLMDPEAAAEKVIVNTDIRMTGNLFNPELSFGITFPNMQEQTKTAIYAVLDTNDAGLMNQQAISLLVLGSFSNTGTGGATNPVNPAAIVSNTLSNMLSQISNDFNIGINYVPGDQVSDEQLEVALSTQLLDDRLVIDGNFDVTGSNANTQKTSSIVGDINVEYKLTPDGRFRLKAFNRSNDLTLFNDYAPYTQGVGIFYRKDFNTLKELFTKYGSETQQKDKK